MFNVPGWTWGVEHEIADFPLKRELPSGCQHNRKDFTIVNSNGIANDPTGKLYGYGGEINTTPTSTWEEQVDILRAFRRAMPEARVNYRSNLHIHIRVPQLKRDLSRLKMLNSYIFFNMPELLPIIEPIKEPMPSYFKSSAAYEGAQKRYKRMLVSHHTLPNRDTFDRQALAVSWQNFFELEAPWDAKRNRPLYHLKPRACINLRQMLDTDTIEFRHFPGTLSARHLATCLQWCAYFLLCAFDNEPIRNVKRHARKLEFPTFKPYRHDLELKYRQTVHDGTVSKDDIARNIRRILEEGN